MRKTKYQLCQVIFLWSLCKAKSHDASWSKQHPVQLQNKIQLHRKLFTWTSSWVGVSKCPSKVYKLGNDLSQREIWYCFSMWLIVSCKQHHIFPLKLKQIVTGNLNKQTEKERNNSINCLICELYLKTSLDTNLNLIVKSPGLVHQNT